MLLSEFQLDPHRVLNIVEEKFGFYSTGYIQHLNSLENRVFELEFEEQDGKRFRRVVKFYRPGRWDRNFIQEEHDFCYELSHLDVDVVLPLQDSEGETLFEHHGLLWSCFEKAGGYIEHEPGSNRLHSLGSYLGKIHRLGQNFQFQHRLNLKERLDLKNSTISVIENISAGIASRFQDSADLVRAALSREWEGSYQGSLHGDLHAANILWLDEYHPRFLDFDDSCTGPFFQDIFMLVQSSADFYIFLEGYEEFGQREWLGVYTDQRRDLYRLMRMLSYWAWMLKRRQDPFVCHFFPDIDRKNYWDKEAMHFIELAHLTLEHL